MRKNLGAKAYTYPQPVFILAAYGEDGTPNAMNAAWGGISDEKELTMCISAGHKTTEDILARKAFTVSMADAAHVEACDYVGIVSGTKEPDKFANAGFHAVKSEFIDAPLIEELPIAVECRLKSYDPESCRMVYWMQTVKWMWQKHSQLLSIRLTIPMWYWGQPLEERFMME